LLGYGFGLIFGIKSGAQLGASDIHCNNGTHEANYTVWGLAGYWRGVVLFFHGIFANSHLCTGPAAMASTRPGH
jgi:hypothetical protein